MDIKIAFRESFALLAAFKARVEPKIISRNFRCFEEFSGKCRCYGFDAWKRRQNYDNSRRWGAH
jgi:hypothetical protein